MPSSTNSGDPTSEIQIERPSNLLYKKTLIDHEGNKYDVFHQEEYNLLKQIQHHKAIRLYKNKDGQLEEHITQIALRYTYPQEMERLLRMAGLFSCWH
jgi:hypothetical protein